MIEANYVDGQCQVHHSWERLSVSFDVVWRKCQHLSHSASRKGRARRVGLQCHRGEGTAYPYKCHRLFSSPRHRQCGAALIRRISRRMSVFLRSTLDVGEVKRGEGGGQPLSS